MTYCRVFALASLLAAAQAHGATLCVNPGGTGGCFASVQAAVDAAGNGDLVTIAAGTYVENVVIGDRRRLDLEGEDPATTILDGGGIGTTLHLQRATVSLTRLGIQNSGSTGLDLPSSRVTITRCRISANAGAGIAGGSPGLKIFESTIDGNALAGINVYGNLRVVRSTISNNGGGGIRGDRMIVEDSTISGNLVGDGIYVDLKLRLMRSTVVGNSGSGLRASGYGLGRVRSSIVANNVGVDGECSGRFVSLGFNLIEGQCAIGGRTDLDVTGQDPVLGPLQDNGGPTFTHAVMPGSPALGHVTRAADCKRPDQRGIARALPCDIGAFEAP